MTTFRSVIRVTGQTRGIAVLLVAAIALPALAQGRPDEPKTARYYRQQAAAAYKAK